MVESDFKLASCVIFPVSRSKHQAQLEHAVDAGNLSHSDRRMTQAFKTQSPALHQNLSTW